MGRQRSQSRAKIKALDKLLQKGIGVVALGVGLLAAPAFMSNSAFTRTFASGVRVPALFALLIGAVLLGLHFFLKARTKARTKAQKRPTSRQEPNLASPVPPRPSGASDRRAAQASTEPPSSSSRAAAPAPAPDERRPQTAWSQQVFDDIEWRRFEAVCEKLFAQGGFETRSQSHGADGGVDIWLHSKNADGPAAVVQCKHWHGKQVGVKEMREFFGVMSSHKLKRGTYATTSTFTEDAAKFAKDNGINALDGARLLTLIAKRAAEQQRDLLATAYDGDYWRPTCASCGIKMVERTKKAGGAAFWGCATYPKCRSILPMRQPA